MRTRSALTVFLAVGCSLGSCSDESPGAGVGPDTSWQVFCAPGQSCDEQDPHGPLEGRDPDDKDDDYKLKVSCSNPGSGLKLTIEDPGREENVGKQLARRPRSILEISRGKPADKECYVTVTEYPNGGGTQLVLRDGCENSDINGTAGTCVLEGEENSNGYAFEGTLQCEGLRYKGAGEAAWMLRAARDQDEPVVLQIANCD